MIKFDRRLLWFAPSVLFLGLIEAILLFGGQMFSFQGIFNTVLLITLIVGIDQTRKQL